MLESRQGLRFFDKPIQTPLIRIGVVPARNWLNLVGLDAAGYINRQVFFGRNPLVEIGIVGEIRNSKTALAEDTVDLVPVKTIAIW